eukprot:3187940-Lingulodinium_polyedra.AAC.1
MGPRRARKDQADLQDRQDHDGQCERNQQATRNNGRSRAAKQHYTSPLDDRRIGDDGGIARGESVNPKKRRKNARATNHRVSKSTWPSRSNHQRMPTTRTKHTQRALYASETIKHIEGIERIGRAGRTQLTDRTKRANSCRRIERIHRAERNGLGANGSIRKQRDGPHNPNNPRGCAPL